jgi:hypothetical protein
MLINKEPPEDTMSKRTKPMILANAVFSHEQQAEDCIPYMENLGNTVDQSQGNSSFGEFREFPASPYMEVLVSVSRNAECIRPISIVDRLRLTHT